MRIKLSLVGLATALMVVPVIFAGSAKATSEGQIEGGDIYRVKNVTKNIDFTDPANADACNLLQYKVRIHDPGPGFLTDVRVQATLPSGAATSNTSTVTVSAINADPSSTSDTAVVNLSSSQSLSYQNGTTQLLDANNNVITALPDGITQGGVSIGDVGVSIDNKRFVQFQVKVGCPPPVQPQFSCTALDVTTSSGRRVDASVRYTATGGASLSSVNFNWGDNTAPTTTSQTSASHVYGQDGTYTIKSILTFNVGSGDKNTATDVCTKTVSFTTPTGGKTLPDTGPGSVAGLFAGVSAIAGAGHYFVTRRARQ